MTRRNFYRYGAMLLGGLASFALMVPGVPYLLDPLRKKLGAAKTYPLAKLSELEVGVPSSFAIVDERRDAWVKFPKEPIGLVWLVRQPDGSETPVLAFQAECPHLGCSIGLAEGGKSFRCPCHEATFTLDGAVTAGPSSRRMDLLEIEPIKSADATVRVRFQRFRNQATEKIPLV